ncbi:MAG: hypothetical protein V3V01_02570 [Acidimicrobiales bacterium]
MKPVSQGCYWWSAKIAAVGEDLKRIVGFDRLADRYQLVCIDKVRNDV